MSQQWLGDPALLLHACLLQWWHNARGPHWNSVRSLERPTLFFTQDRLTFILLGKGTDFFPTYFRSDKHSLKMSLSLFLSFQFQSSGLATLQELRTAEREAALCHRGNRRIWPRIEGGVLFYFLSSPIAVYSAKKNKLKKIAQDNHHCI